MTDTDAGAPRPGRGNAAAPGHAEWIQDQLGGLLNFCAAAADRDNGGFDGLTTTGRRLPGPKHLYATARMTDGFTLGSMLGRPGCAELAAHGLRALRTIFHDDAQGGWFAELSADGADRQRGPAATRAGHRGRAGHAQ